ncbi:hypothetical protein MY1884_002534 [Beauveria asiatica]
MTSPKQARPPVKRALKLAPPQANLTGLTHVHSTRPKNQVELLTSPGSHAQTEPVYINTNAIPQPFLDASLLQKETRIKAKT